MAADSPPGPPPITTTSYSIDSRSTMVWYLLVSIHSERLIMSSGKPGLRRGDSLSELSYWVDCIAGRIELLHCHELGIAGILCWRSKQNGDKEVGNTRQRTNAAPSGRMLQVRDAGALGRSRRFRARQQYGLLPLHGGSPGELHGRRRHRHIGRRACACAGSYLLRFPAPRILAGYVADRNVSTTAGSLQSRIRGRVIHIG